MCAKIKVAIVTGVDGLLEEYRDYFLPFHISEWEEVEEEEVEKIRQGLAKLKGPVVGGILSRYSLIQMPIDQKAVIIKSLKEYEKMSLEREKENRRYLAEQEKREKNEALKKKLRTLKRTLENVSTQEAKVALEKEIKQLQNSVK